MTFPVPSHAAARSPEDVRGVLAGVEQLPSALQHPLEAGMSYHAQASAPAHVPLMARGGGVVHADHAVRPVDLRPSLAPGQPAGAGDQGAGPAVHLQRLASERVKVRGDRGRRD